MSSNVKSYLKRSWQKKLAVAVTAGLLTGTYAPCALAAEYTQGLTGTVADNEWLGSEVVSDLGGSIFYEFTGDNSFNINGNSATGLSLGKNSNTYIYASGKTLTFNTTANRFGNSNATGISILEGSNVNIYGNLNIAAHNTMGNFAHGIVVEKDGSSEGAKTTVGIQGSVTMRGSDPDNPWAVSSYNMYGGYGPGGSASNDAPDYTGARWAPAGIKLGTGFGSSLTINGDVDLAIKGSAVVVDPYYADSEIDDKDLAIINLNGGKITIETPECDENTYYALANYGGTININMPSDAPGANDVNIKGNIIVMKEDAWGSGGPYFYRDGEINMALTTANSKWTGVIDNSGTAQAGDVNLWLQNGAVWEHKSMSVTNGMQVDNMPSPSNDQYGTYDRKSHVASLNGGSSANNAGYIIQNSSAPIIVDQYSGYNVVVYRHNDSGTLTSDYLGGDFTINNAAVGSGITLSTNNANIDMDDVVTVQQVLNALAGKLTYAAYVSGEDNLQGKVQIAEGLTASSAAQKVGDIVFDSATGKGTNVDGAIKEEPEDEGYTTTITGSADADTQYADVILQSTPDSGNYKEGAYKFSGNTEITVSDKGNATVNIESNAGGWNTITKQIGTDGSLTLNSIGSGNEADYGVRNAGLDDVNLNVGSQRTEINVVSEGKAYGVAAENTESGAWAFNETKVMFVNGGLNESNADVNITAQGQQGASGIYVGNRGVVNIYGNLHMQADGLHTYAADGEQQYAVDGGVYDNFATTGIHVNAEAGFNDSVTVYGSADMSVNGTGILAEGVKGKVTIEQGASILTRENKGSVNYAVAANGGTVNINYDTYYGTANSGVSNIYGNIGLLENGGTIKLAITGADSTLDGVAVHTGGSGTLELMLSDGAVWTNAAYGATDASFDGSVIDVFKGGSSDGTAGFIVQKDTRNLTINNYSGSAVVYYEHANDGSARDDYAAGDTIVKTAAAGSGLTLSTSSANIDMTDTGKVDNVLNALAGKLVYEEHTEGAGDNLSGWVQIADGLTTSSASKKAIVYGEDGRGTSGDASQPEGPDEPGTGYTTTITGNASTDTEYADVILQNNPDSGEYKAGDYKFSGDTDITVQGGAAIDSESQYYKNYNVGTDGSLTLNAVGADYGVKHIVSDDMMLSIGSKTTNINVESEGKAYGVAAENNGFFSESRVYFKDSDLNLKGADVNITVQGQQGAAGIYVGDGGTVNVYGNLHMQAGEDRKYAVDGSVYDDFATTGIHVNAGSNIFGNTVTVYGSADMSVNGTGILAEGSMGKVTIEQGASILTNANNGSVNYAVAANGGTVSVNYGGNGTSNIKGNIGLLDNGGTVKLALNTGGSTLDGVVVRTGDSGTLELTLSNGAAWTNAAYGATSDAFSGSVVDVFNGGSGSGLGYIVQKDTHNLTINNYSGSALVYYEHEGDGSARSDYAAGDTIVKAAADGSVITLSTNSAYIDMTDTGKVDNVLNALAGKLVYEEHVSGTDNLSGWVQIAEGLTTSAARKEAIKYDGEGRGTYGSDQIITEFSRTITGDAAKDAIYADAKVLQADGSYVFERDSSIELTDGAAAVDAEKDLTITAGEEKTLTMSSSGESENVAVIRNDGQIVDIIADTLNIKAENTSANGYANGVYVKGTADKQAVTTITGDVNIAASGSNVIGVQTQGNSQLNIDGKLTMDSGNARYGYYAASGIFAGGDSASSMGSEINITGGAELNGYGVAANGNGSAVNISGDSSITAGSGGMAVSAQGGSVNVNVDENGAGDGAVNITGNIGLTSDRVIGWSTPGATQVNIGLTTEKSSLEGVIVNNFTSSDSAAGYTAEANLYLANGAVWTNAVYGGLLPSDKFSGSEGSTLAKLTGGDSEAVRGVIFQKDENDIHVGSYSGHTLVIYEHEGNGSLAENYTAGDFIVGTAASNSVITLSTDNSGIAMNDNDQVAAALNALAGKLTYEAYVDKNGAERNLSGVVQIAEGLTASSTAQIVKDITFDESTGKGSYVKPDDSAVSEYATAIFEDNYQGAVQRAYWDGQRVRTESSSDDFATYRFDTNTVIDWYTDGTIGGQQQQNGQGVINWAGKNDGVIDMTGHKLTLISDGHNSLSTRERPSGIKIGSGTLNINNVQGLDITVKNGYASYGGIYVVGMPSEGAWDNGDGDAHLIINNDGGLENAVKIRFENSSNSNAAITLDKNTGSAALDITGLADIVTDGFAAVYNTGGTANIGGGKLLTSNYNVIDNRGGSTFINAAVDEDGSVSVLDEERDVAVMGNIVNTGSGSTAVGNWSAGSVGLGLTTADSYFEGVASTEEGSATSILLANGALWTNASSTALNDGLTGSRVNLSSGSSADKAGYILQRDSQQLVIDKYSGNTVVMYEHTGDGSQTGDYAAGDTIIKSAAQNSGIVLSTTNDGMDMDDESEVAATLNTLAGKLTYEAYATANGAERNLSGKVQIAEGLTSSSAAMFSGGIQFSDESGKGSYIAESKYDFSDVITGNINTDGKYTEAGILETEGQYDFPSHAIVTIKTNGGTAGINMEKDVTINAENGALNIVSEGTSYSNVNGIKHQITGNLVVNADELNVTAVNNEDYGGARAVELSTNRKSVSPNAEINARLDVTAKANGSEGLAYGIYAEGNSNLTVNNNLTMNSGDAGDWAVDGAVYNYDTFTSSSAAIYTKQGTNPAVAGTVTINGDVDLAVNAHGLLATGTGGVINVNGGSITTNKNNSKGLYALAATSNGTVNMNIDNSGEEAAAGTKDVNIEGNIGIISGYMGDMGSWSTTAEVNLGLGTDKSVLHGVIYNSYKDTSENGAANLYLQNGAAWINEQWGAVTNDSDGQAFSGSRVTNFIGGSDAAHCGIIEQKDSNALTFSNYSGHALVFYEHTGDGTMDDDYAAGDTIVKQAAEGSAITMATGSNGIVTTDVQTVNEVLNTLAGKLTYEAWKSGEQNLAGSVMIAEGLTSSSAAKVVGDITYNDEGKGTYVPEVAPEIPDHQINVDFATPITGNKDRDKEYLYGGVLQEAGEGSVSYDFTEDSNINITAKNGKAIDVQKDVIVNAEGSTLNLQTSYKGVSQSSSNEAVINADRINVNADAALAESSSNGSYAVDVESMDNNVKAELTLNGDVSVQSHGVQIATGFYSKGNAQLIVNGNVTMKSGADDGYEWAVSGTGVSSHEGATAIYAGSSLAAGEEARGGRIDINGDVDLAVDANGALANGSGAVININGGGSIVVNKNNELGFMALNAQSGVVNMNMNEDGSGHAGNKVNISGNIGATNGSVNANEPFKDSVVNLGLGTSDSTLHGVAVNNFNDSQISDGWTGEINLYMAGGATWINEAYGKTVEGFTGSMVENFVGSSDAKNASVIVQKDGNALTINNYSGNTIIGYEHTGDGQAEDAFAAGQTVINHAAANSMVTMSTDSTGIDTEDAEAVNKVLNNLAGKLVYRDFNVSDVSDNLQAKVQIAEGLTSSSAAKIGDIEFNENGGALVFGSVSGGNGGDEGGDIIWGDYETNIMKGARSAMMTSMLSWRDNAANMYNRGEALRRGEEEGAWVRTFGGKSKYDGSNVNLENSYWAGQAGYDRTLAGGWNVGVALDYQEGNGSYLLGGKGDNKLYSLGVYGTKDLGNNAYLDIVAKAGKVKNEFDVYSSIGQKLEGDYSARGYSVSAQYGKRFGLTNKGYIEPQAQLTWAHLDSKNYDTYSGTEKMHISQDAFDSFVGRLGVKAGVETAHGGFYARLSLAHEFAGDVTATYSAGQVKRTSYDFGDTWSELTLGGSYNLSKCSNFYADITRSLSGDYQYQWRLNAGVQFTF